MRTPARSAGGCLPIARGSLTMGSMGSPGSLGSQILLVAVLVLLNAAFAGSEMALISVRASQLSRPAVWLLGKSSDAVVRAVGGDPGKQRDDVSEEELRDMVALQPELSDEERAIITGAFEFADRTLREIVVPRPAVVGVPADLAAAAAAQLLVDRATPGLPSTGQASTTSWAPCTCAA